MAIKNLNFSKKVKKHEILVTLKEEASTISIMDIMKSCTFLRDNAKYVHANYRKEYIKSYIKAFITRLKVLKDDKRNYSGNINPDEIKEAINLLNEQESQLESGEGFDPHFFKIYKIMSIYTTFILEEPVHPPGTPFPGG